MRKSLWLLILLVVLVTGNVFAETGKEELEKILKEADTLMEQKKPVVWRYLLGGTLGMSNLIKGYDNYRKNYSDFGIDVRFMPERDKLPLRFSCRISLEYFPLVVPEGTYGLKENIYALSSAILVNFYKHRYFDSYIGFGPGFYFDYIKLSTPITGDISGMYNYFGFNISLGTSFKIGYNVMLCPEVRMHSLVGQEYIATYMSFQCGILYYLP